MVYLVKIFSLVIFGAAEIACGCVGAFQSVIKFSSNFDAPLAEKALLLGLLYLVSKGIENLDKGYK